MDFNGIISSTKSYKIALVIAIALLLLLSSISYRQIINMRNSADLVSGSLLVDKEINNLFSKFSLIEASGYKSLIVNDSTFKDTYSVYKNEAETSFKQLAKLTQDIPEQRQYLDTINHWRDSLDISLNNINNYRGLLEEDVEDKLMAEVVKMASIFQKLASLKLGMSQKKDVLFRERINAYKTETFFTPFISLLLVLFSLTVFLLAFVKINNSRKELLSAQGFVDNIISNSNNLVNYFKPIIDENGKVIDFIFEYSNNKIEEITGIPTKQIIGTKLSKSFPITMTNGLFDMYVTCLNTGKVSQLTRPYIFKEEEVWLKSIVSKLEMGVNVTTIDVSQEKHASENLKKLNESLFLKNAILNNAEVVAKIGSFTSYPEMGVTDMSDNLYRLLGVKPGDFEPCLENLMTYVHPDDVQKFKKTFAKGISSKGITEVTYRIITKDKKRRYFKSTTLMIVENGTKKMVGVIQNITQSIKKDKKLEQKNKALKLINTELESFNRVASHDLQEPLRKIQMFISLLSETERNNFSEKGLAYLDKIDNSTERMQLLIKNLLTYSRIDNTLDGIQPIDLNNKMKKVKDNLSESIKESNITIVENNLPTINGIPFQIEQLFTNLISNAIKYKKLTEGAQIVIDATKVKPNQLPTPFNNTENAYYEIKISDNGIGFEQENAEKIFNIFERLHQKTEYSGTGIGLAICKKIVDNHHGYICATSKIGIGSTFYIYLPV